MLVVLRTVLGIPVDEGVGECEGAGTSGKVAPRVGTEGVEFALVLGVGRPERVTDREGMAVRFGVEVGSCEGEIVDVRGDSEDWSY